MPTQLLTPAGRPVRHRSEQRFLGDLVLARGRVHEFCGPARVTLALMLAGAMEGTVLWIRAPHLNHGFNTDGIARLTHPARLIFASPHRAEDVLWTMEEACRSGAPALVVAELPGPPALTPVRRLQLACETGGRVIGLLLTPAAGGASGVESRWAMAPNHTGTSTAWQLDRLRARMEPPKSWRVTPDGGAYVAS